MDAKVRPPNRGCYSSLTGGGIASSNRGRGLEWLIAWFLLEKAHPLALHFNVNMSI